MSLTTVSTPRLSEVARHLIIPEGIVTSAFPRVYRRLTDVGVSFDLWQQGFGQVALGCRADGKYAATIGGVVAPWPRQVGKTYTVGNLVIGACLEFPGLRAIWTSHHNRTTTNTFRSMQAMVRRRRVAPHIAYNGIRTANGEQEIRFANGSIIMFGAREQGFGRGMDAIDWEIFDEAQILGLKALEDMVPATNAAKHQHGGLVFFLGTPPRPGDDGEAFTTKRAKALAGKTADQVYCEISADPSTDPDDQSMYHTFNPSYPHRTPLESMLRMRENIPDAESWRREAMGIWPADGVAVVSAQRWRELADPGPSDGTAPDSFGVAAHDGQFSVIACWADDEDRFVEEVFAHARLDLVAEWIVPRSRRRMPVLVPNYGAAAPLLPMLQAKRRNAKAASSVDVGRGCELIVAGTDAGWLTHADQKQLADSLAGSRKKFGRDGAAWTFDLKTSTHNAPAMAMALSLAGAAGVRNAGATTKTKRKAVLA
ncbi:terminase [Gordonia sp. ABSL49_1]|uniref:terminase n=1 Tax=Gordonia sp. ABSL49_1 TaxID=2920941 RepID=UPI001F0DD4AE|nr:terminase [Gordonia sp. ABSL49_1]MCH5645152.1 terminase [Gordonia sp. ABSL49_1]